MPLSDKRSFTKQFAQLKDEMVHLWHTRFGTCTDNGCSSVNWGKSFPIWAWHFRTDLGAVSLRNQALSGRRPLVNRQREAFDYLRQLPQLVLCSDKILRIVTTNTLQSATTGFFSMTVNFSLAPTS